MIQPMPAASDKTETYRLLTAQLETLLQEEPHVVPALSNASALLMYNLPQLNWSGFYLTAGNQLVLGPFQGKPACIHIPLGKGVCGTAAVDKRTLLVPDVHSFPGHIACDSASCSEIVVPLVYQEQLAGVMDLDSPIPERFDEQDRQGLEAFACVLMKHCLWGEFQVI